MNNPRITCDSGLILREMLIVELDKVKQSKEIEFDDIVDFNAQEVREWLITFVNVNEYNYFLAAELQREAREIEKEIFSQHVKLEIIVAPMKDFIQEKLKKLLQEVGNLKNN